MDPLQAGKWIDQQVADGYDNLVSVRRYLHAHPEASLCEIETTDYLYRQLTEAGLSPTKCEGDCGLIVDVDVGAPDPALPRIAVRADIDGLRMTDRKDVDYKSVNDGIAHTCGHDAHSTVVLHVAKLVHEISTTFDPEKRPTGRFRFLFQPAEEVCEGARSLVRQGAMESVGAILGLHVEPLLPAGMVGIRYGALTAHCDEIHMRINGRGGHAARPHHTTDPISAAAQLISALYQILPRTTDSREPSVFTIGRIVGGLAPNVIPDEVKLEGTLRSVDSNSRLTIRKRISDVCHAVASMTGNDVTVDWGHNLAAVRNDSEVTRVVHDVARDVIGDESILEIAKPSMGGEDFSAYLDHAPGCQIRLGCARPGEDWPLLHSPVFDIDERALGIGVRVLTRSAFALANHLATLSKSPAVLLKRNHIPETAMSTLKFTPNDSPTIGVEIELQLVDAETLALSNSIEDVLSRLSPALAKQVKPELMQSYLEINTSVCTTVREAGADLRTKLEDLERVTGMLGIKPFWAGTHPFSSWRDQKITVNDRYYRLVELMQDVARRLVTFGLHVHVGVDTGDKAVMVCERILRHLPLLLALSSNSPFWEGRRTGLHSNRSKVMEGLPTAGLPHRVRNWSEYVWLINHLVDTGFINTIREIWWDVRPHHSFGTVEIRVCDMPANLDAALSLAGMVQCLVHAISKQIDEGTFQSEYHPMMVQQNKWRATRFGADAKLVNSDDYQQYTVKDRVELLVEKLLPTASELDCVTELQSVSALADNTGTQQQLAIYERTGDLRQVVHEMLAQNQWK